MKENDGIAIADRPSWALSFRELLAILAKRVIALPSKLIGFKPFCLLLATWLLVEEKIDGWMWFLVLVSVLFGIVGLKVAMRYRGGTEGGGDEGVGDGQASGKVASGGGGGAPGAPVALEPAREPGEGECGGGAGR